jgi:hypothetical protein
VGGCRWGVEDQTGSARLPCRTSFRLPSLPGISETPGGRKRLGVSDNRPKGCWAGGQELWRNQPGENEASRSNADAVHITRGAGAIH